jgi:hypothetical protein
MRHDGVKIENRVDLGIFWMMGWMFTIGFLKLSFMKGALALLIWPYLVGQHFANLPGPAISG